MDAVVGRRRARQLRSLTVHYLRAARSRARPRSRCAIERSGRALTTRVSARLRAGRAHVRRSRSARWPATYAGAVEFADAAADVPAARATLDRSSTGHRHASPIATLFDVPARARRRRRCASPRRGGHRRLDARSRSRGRSTRRCSSHYADAWWPGAVRRVDAAARRRRRIDLTVHFRAALPPRSTRDAGARRVHLAHPARRLLRGGRRAVGTGRRRCSPSRASSRCALMT